MFVWCVLMGDNRMTERSEKVKRPYIIIQKRTCIEKSGEILRLWHTRGDLGAEDNATFCDQDI